MPLLNESDHEALLHLRRLVNRVPAMMAYWDRDLRCGFANQAYKTWFGVEPERLVGQSMRELLGPRLFALNEPYILGALRGEEQLFERIVPGPDGVQRHSLANYLPDVVDGVVVGFMVLVTEVTQLKNTQAALQREQALRAEIEDHARRLNLLLNERNEMLDVLAHEVRQPLNNASAALQGATAALSEIGGEVATQPLMRAQAVLGQVLASIDNTLAVAALLARPEPIEPEDTDIDMLLAVAIADMPAAERGRIRVERATATRTASMAMSLMRLALRNLLANALQYSPAGSPVTVRVSDLDEPLALVIDVIDTGTGLPASLLPRLFERGARGDPAPGSGGHGLGLYIVRRVMELHGGQVLLLHNAPGEVVMRLLVVQSTHDGWQAGQTAFSGARKT